MHSLIYVSSAVVPFSPRQLRELLAVCHDNNRRHDITGMLLYKDGNFMQVLEGERGAVSALHRAIATDPRHGGLITLLEGDSPGRQFAAWSMGFRDLGADIDHPEGYSEFLNLPLNGSEFQKNPGHAQRLLLSFKKLMRADKG